MHTLLDLKKNRRKNTGEPFNIGYGQCSVFTEFKVKEFCRFFNVSTQQKLAEKIINLTKY